MEASGGDEFSAVEAARTSVTLRSKALASAVTRGSTDSVSGDPSKSTIIVSSFVSGSPSRCSRKISMGFLIWWRTLSVTLPISSRVIPERPWLDMATNDSGDLSPSCASQVTSTPEIFA